MKSLLVLTVRTLMLAHRGREIARRSEAMALPQLLA